MTIHTRLVACLAFEIADNGDCTLSIFSTIFDAFPAWLCGA